MPINKRIIFKLMSNLKLDYEELCYVFDDIRVRMVPNYNKLYRAIKYLLMNVEGRQQQLLVELINKDFEIYPHYRVDLDTLEDVFDCWQFKCNNKETGKFLIDLTKKCQLKEKNAALNNFKDSLQDYSNNVKTDETMAKEIIATFKKDFEAMSYEEREEYLKKYGFNFGSSDDERLL